MRRIRIITKKILLSSNFLIQILIGLGAPLRMVLVHAGADFEDKRYQVTGEPGNWSKACW